MNKIFMSALFLTLGTSGFAHGSSSWELPHDSSDTAPASSWEGPSDTDGSVVITPVPSQPQTATKYVYLRCNATSWNLEDKNLLTPVGEGYSITYSITQEWMVEGGDSCVFTVTDVKGQWTPNTREYLPALANGEVALESHGYVTVSPQAAGAANFRIRYSSLGNYTAFINLESNQFYVMKLYYHGHS